MPVAVDPLVPPARLGALLVARRTVRGLDLADMAQKSNGVFTPTFLANVERGRVLLDDHLVQRLVGLYEVHAGPVVPQRSELVLDIDRQHLAVGEQTVPFDSLHAEDILERYVSLIYVLRDLAPGSDLVLRDKDLDVLASSLGYTATDVRREIETLVAAPDSVRRAQSVSRRTMVLAAGLLVGVTAIGTLVLVGLPDRNNIQTEVLSQSQTLIAATGFPAEAGVAAEATIDFDFRSALDGWQIFYGEDHPDFLGVTHSENKTITVHVEPGSTTESVAAVLMHEVGHALDLERLDDAQRAHWIAMRDMPATWWPGDGLSDFAVGAGDFAEAVASYTTGSPSRSVYGEFTESQLAFVAEIVNG